MNQHNKIISDLEEMLFSTHPKARFIYDAIKALQTVEDGNIIEPAIIKKSARELIFQLAVDLKAPITSTIVRKHLKDNGIIMQRYNVLYYLDVLAKDGHLKKHKGKNKTVSYTFIMKSDDL